jgi:hypothetical protein
MPSAMKWWLVVLVAVFGVATAPAGAAAPHNAGAATAYEHVVSITKCEPRRSRNNSENLLTTNASLSITYTNLTAKPMKRIVFGLFANHKLVTEVSDSGTFGPHVAISHPLPISVGLFPMQTPVACQPLHATFADGTTIANPFRPTWEVGYTGPRL